MRVAIAILSGVIIWVEIMGLTTVRSIKNAVIPNYISLAEKNSNINETYMHCASIF